MCDPVTFPNVNPAHWELIASKVKGSGILINADHGTVQIENTELIWDYERLTETLTVQCIHKLFVLPCARVNAKIQELFFSTLRAALLKQKGKKP